MLNYTIYRYATKYSLPDPSQAGGWGFKNFYDENKDFVDGNDDMDYVYQNFLTKFNAKKNSYQWNASKSSLGQQYGI